MSPYIQSIILGIVEGLTEFLPVSSTAHLRIAEALMKIPLDDAYWRMYTIVIQLGAIIALCILYLSRIVDFLRTFPEGPGDVDLVMIYEVQAGRIARAWTIVGKKTLHRPA